MRTMFRAAVAAALCVSGFAAQAQMAPTGPAPVPGLANAGKELNVCILQIEPRSENGKTIVIGQAKDAGGGGVFFSVTANEFKASLNAGSATVPDTSSGWPTAAPPPIVQQLLQAGAAGVRVRLVLGGSVSAMQPVQRVIYFYTAPSCRG